MATKTLRVRGLRECQAALHKYNREVKKEVATELRVVAEPVRARAETLAHSEIENIGPRWFAMRIGVTQKSVYVAPKSKRRGGSPRPSLAPMLLNLAMIPALDAEEPTIYTSLELALDRLGTECGF